LDTLYIEEEVASHPRTLELLERYSSARQVPIQRFGDVFNASSQNFRAQKQAPALILAEKSGRRVLPTPPGYHIGGTNNFYFSHMLNCVYDCRYCFLQGMYRSGNHVVFVNFEDFFDDIETTAAQHVEPSWFFTGYDCDSLALDPMTGFVDACLNHFENNHQVQLELRTKSTQIRPLLKRKAMDNVVAAFSLSPKAIVASEEHGTPSLEKRLDALQRLQTAGWKIGLRFDPLLYADNFESLYGPFFDEVFDALDTDSIHSVTLGTFRLPKGFHKRMVTLYPDARLLATGLVPRGSSVSYPHEVERTMVDFCEKRIRSTLRDDQYFPASLT